MKVALIAFSIFAFLLIPTSVYARDLDDSKVGTLLERFSQATPSASEVPARKLELLREREEKKTELQEKLQNIKDEAKQKTVEKLSERLSMMNENWTNHWNNVLERLSKILEKIQARAKLLSENGKDISGVTQQINYAQAAIDTAQSAVDLQSEKIYTFEITEDSNVREDVKSTIAQFKEDTKKVLSNIKSARENVRLALIEVGKLTGERIGVEKEDSQ